MIDLELYLLRGVFPLLLANILIDGKKQFVQSIWIKLRLFTFSTLLFPLAIKLVNNINNNPMQNTTTHMFFQAGAIYNWLSFILVFATIFAFLSYLPIYMFGWVKSPTYVRTVFTFSLLIIISLSIMFEMN